MSLARPLAWPPPRQHWLFLTLLGLGTALRILAMAAYRPALLYVDSFRYLGPVTPAGDDPAGYTLLARGLSWTGGLTLVVALQHLLGLAMGVGVYVLLRRAGVRSWIAALAAAPVLLDAYQIQIEQNIMSDAFFEAVVLAAVAVLAWRRPVRWRQAVLAGLLLGVSVTIRLVGEFLPLVAVAYLVVAGAGTWTVVWRERWRRLLTVGALLAGFAVPVGGYVLAYTAVTGTVGISPETGSVLYAATAEFVDCRTLSLPAYERALCPAQPLGHRLSVDYYENAPGAPIKRLHPPPGMTPSQVERNFAMRAIRQRPLAFLEEVVGNFGKGFALRRTTDGQDVPVDRWYFQLTYPSWPPTYGLPQIESEIAHAGGGGPAVYRPFAEVLRGYQLSIGYTPGPVLGVALLLALLATAGLGGARRSGLRAECLLWAGAGVLVVSTADAFLFSWRYQLPGLILIPAAGALGVTALLRRRDRVAAAVPAPDRELAVHR